MEHACPITAFMAPETDDIYVAKAWRPKLGQPMPNMPGYFIGKKFGAGALSMNSIYDLVDEQGSSKGLALKVCKQTMSARRSLAHEWKMFKDLNLLGEEHPAARSHFLQAHRVLKLNNDTIVGIVMEKANGKNVVKTLKDPAFCNVRYVIALIRDLLVALDVAQRVLGFAHYDLKLDNIMEHWSCSPDPQRSRSRVMMDGVPQFKLFDFGTAVVYPDPFSVKTPTDEHLKPMAPAAAEQLAHEKLHGDSDKPGAITHSARDSEFEYSEPFYCVRVYHMWWAKRGDVYRVLAALCRLLDDHTWPVEDLELVSLLFTVLEHSTNSKRLKARFVLRADLLRKQRLKDEEEGEGEVLGQGCAAAQRQKQQQQQQQVVGREQQALQLNPLRLGQHERPPPSPVTAVAGSSPTTPISSSSSSQPQQHLADPVMFEDSAAAAAARPDRYGFSSSRGSGGVAVEPAAAAGPVSPTRNGRRSFEVQLHNTNGSPVPAGVAFTRLTPPASPVAPAAAAAASSSSTASSSDGAAAAAAGVAALVGVAEPEKRARAERAAAAGAPAGTARVDAFLQEVDEAEDEGCRVDPAAHVVASQPLAPPSKQSVFGSRKALKGVTAQQLLLEPVVQSLLSKV